MHKRHFHCLKYTCGTMLRDAGVEIAGIQDHLGHADIRSTMYAHGTETQRRDVAKRLEATARSAAGWCSWVCVNVAGCAQQKSRD